eukprot:GHVH01008992.1.p1 GENE.GHVH01008992.1~~GHVH01008992.1.p1  ORF type:complete len:895 (-),score=123.94 GHVH01008992.1:96-2780(-)
MPIPESVKSHQFSKTVKSLDEDFYYFDIKEVASKAELQRLPCAIKVILENTVRSCNGESVTEQDVKNVVQWGKTAEAQEVGFCPARVLLQDFTGVPAVVDLAAMRHCVNELGGPADKINPLVPTELVIDHSIVVDRAGDSGSLKNNENMEFERNSERFGFLKWGAEAFKNMRVIPPGNGICHQVNLEYLGRGVFVNESSRMVYPDTVVGTDSHTTMISGLGILGWGVGGIEAEAVMLGEPCSLMLPDIVGFELTGEMNSLCTATDLVLTITSILRNHGVVGKIVEFFGEGCRTLSVADRATIANMAPEYGATTGFFPPDERTLEYLENTGRDPVHLERVRKYWAVSGLQDISGAEYTETVQLDLSSITPCVAGPKRPQDLVAVSCLKKSFIEGLVKPIDFSSFGLPDSSAKTSGKCTIGGKDFMLHHGSVVIAAITSCTNTSNPAVMIGAGLLARSAHKKGVTVPAFVKTSLSPGSSIVQQYLEKSGLDIDLQSLGFYVTGYGCMTCIGNSGDLLPEVDECIKSNDLVASAVLSGNRNFEGRVHPLTRANYLASPMLVVAYAIAGRVDIDFEIEPLTVTANGDQVFLRDVWPAKEEIEQHMKVISREMYEKTYRTVSGSDQWKALSVPESSMYQWNETSTYVQNPPFFDGMTLAMSEPLKPIIGARVLGLFGDSITTDHISPAGKITADSPAGEFLLAHGVDRRLFNSYGSRRGNDRVMVRGTFANVRLVNKLASKVGPFTRNMSTGDKTEKYFYTVANEYRESGIPSIIFGGQFYGSGSSRDWAAKGTALQGVKAVIVESFERIHRSNLIGVGVLPLQFKNGESVESHKITGEEAWNINIDDVNHHLTVGGDVNLTSDKGHNITVLCRIDTIMELKYFRAGGILHYMIKRMCA